MKRFILMLTVFALTACGSKEDASNGNFTSALNQYMAKYPELCIGYGGWRWTPDGEKALEKAGISAGKGLTEAGKKFYRKQGEVGRFMVGQVISMGDMEHNQFLCYGKVSLDKVMRWDAPTNNFTRVAFTYHVTDIADWAKDKDVQSGFPILKRMVEGDGTLELRVVAKLTSDGWQIIGE